MWITLKVVLPKDGVGGTTTTVFGYCAAIEGYFEFLAENVVG